MESKEINKENIINNEIKEKGIKNINKKENKNKIQKNICQICSNKKNKNEKIKCILFNNCNHEICYICLYKILIRSYKKQIAQIYNTNNKINIKCICELGQKEMTIEEIINILSILKETIVYPNIEQKDEIIETNELKCKIHKDVIITEYCLQCYEPICAKCLENKNKKRKNNIHENHKIISYKTFYNKLYNNLLNIPNLKVILENHKNSIKNLYEKYSDLINIKFESVINEINYIKEKMIINLKKEYDKCKPSMEAINLLYEYYNYELVSINKDTKIDQLMFLYNTEISLPEINYQFPKTVNILNKIVKELNESNLENIFEYKFNSIKTEKYKCVQTISDAHNTNINNLCILNNKNIASGDYNGNIKIWKISNNRYILSQEIKKIYEGVINSICNIYLNKFAVCSQISDEINIFQENINDEKYVNIQKIKLNDKNKFFNKINTLNDNISLIVTTKDYYIYIYQDKIGGIPKQNYMKTNYELVEFFDSLHRQELNYIIHTINEKIITACEDTTLKVWNKDRSYFTLNGHTDSVNIVIEIDKNNLCSGSSDNNIIIWNINENESSSIGTSTITNESESENQYKLKQTLIGHDFSVIGLVYLNNDKLVSASNDETIKIWQRNKYDLFINQITIKAYKVSGIANINDILVTYSWDKSIKIWVNYNIKEFDINEKKDKVNNISNNKIEQKRQSLDNIIRNSINNILSKEENEKKMK